MTEASLPLIIHVKVRVPPVRQPRVRRPRLTDILNCAMAHPLTLVSSLAGSGKTTALAEWAGQLSAPAAWYSIDEADNDARRFLFHFLTALQAAVPGAAAGALEALRSPEPLSIEHVVSLLINDLAGDRPDFVLILDDYHRIQSSDIHQAMAFLIEHMPAPLHLVIATRADPVLPLARLRARGSLLELRIDQLRFTPAEVSAYFNQVMELGLSESDLEVVQSRTEGWAASLQLAALSLKQSRDGKAFLRAFSGVNRYILDYLVEEVLNGQSEAVQTFLLKTCILERMCGPLCDALTGEENGEAMLAFLERSNLFLVPLDEDASGGRVTRWYRYHHLFADLLRSRLAHSPLGQELKTLHRRASLWFERNGLAEEAIRCALAAQDYLRAAQQIEATAETAWLDGQYITLLGWIRSLPEEVIYRRPWLCIWNAWSLTQMGSLEHVSTWIDAAERAIDPRAGQEDAPALTQEIVILRALHAGLAEQYDRALELAKPLLENPPPPVKKAARVAWCNITHGLSSMYFITGELAKAEAMCRETMRVSQEIGFSLRDLHAANKRLYVYRAQGLLCQTHQFLQETLSRLRQQGLENHFAAGLLHCRLIDLLYEWNRVEETRDLIEGLEKHKSLAEVPYFRVDLDNALARDRLCQQDIAGAQDALTHAAALARQSYIWPGLIWQTETLQARLWLQTGQVDRAAAWAAQAGALPGGAISFSGTARAMARARILLAQGEHQEAIGLLDRLASAAETGGWTGRWVEIHALQALALRSAGECGPALQAIERALALAEPEGYLRTFLDEGDAMVALLSAVIQEKPSLPYAQRLLAAFAAEKGSPATDGAASGERQSSPVSPDLAEPLSPRELEVLRCMAEGLSNQETAQKLVIETSTVKRHIHNIFARLGVTNRVQALNQAREKKLL